MLENNRLYWVPIILFVSFIIDGIVSSVFSPLLIEAAFLLIPRMTLVLITIFSFYIDAKFLWRVCVVIGVIYDSYFTGIWGIYMCMLPLSVSLFAWIRKFVHINAFTIGLTLISGIAFVETGVYLFNVMLGFTKMGWPLFVITRLTSSMVLNIVLYYLVYWPVRQISRWINEG